MKIRKLLFLVSAVFFLQPAFELKALEQSKESKQISLLTTYLLMTRHYVKMDYSEKNAESLFTSYLKALDPQKIFFTQEQINKWKPYTPQLLKQLAGQGDATLAYRIFSEYSAKIVEYDKFIWSTHLAEKDLNTNLRYEIDRKDAAWPKNNAEQRELWKKKLLNDLIVLRILDRIEWEEAQKDPKKPVWKKHPPLDRIRNRFHQYVKTVQKYDQLEVLEFYLNALAGLFDPHSSYMAPKNEEDFNINMRLSLVGIGAVLTSTDEGYTKIVQIMPGGPADLDKRLKADDRIIAVQQENQAPVDIIGMPLSQVVSMIRGSVGTKVTLTVLEGSKGSTSTPVKITLIRKKVELKEAEAKGEIRKINGKKIGIITLPSFYIDFAAAMKGDKNYKSSTRDVSRILKDFNNEKVNGVIIDLRSNGGGSLQEAISLTGLFVKEGPVVQIRNDKGNVEVENDNDNGLIAYSGPLILMTNRLSASASEIFAGAIADYHRGLIVGDAKTHGKGTVQTVIELNDIFSYFKEGFKAGILKYSNAKFYRINGQSTQLRGVEPHIIFPSFTNVMELGEEKLERPMKWDTVPQALYEKLDDITPTMIAALKERSARRIQQNKDFITLNKDIERYAAKKKEKTLLLNFDKRWKEYLEEKNLHDKQVKLLHLDTGTTATDKAKENKAKDIYLDETLVIMTDLISLSKK